MAHDRQRAAAGVTEHALRQPRDQRRGRQLLGLGLAQRASRELVACRRASAVAREEHPDHPAEIGLGGQILAGEVVLACERVTRPGPVLAEQRALALALAGVAGREAHAVAGREQQRGRIAKQLDEAIAGGRAAQVAVHGKAVVRGAALHVLDERHHQVIGAEPRRRVVGVGHAEKRRVAGARDLAGLGVDDAEPAGLPALAALDRLAQRLRHALADPASDVRRAIEIGSPAAAGLDKVLVIDHGDRWTVHARRLFRDAPGS